ncbi:unnamed protein product [Meloidogyne enterolobii]|uniref:Uncharacterized protein n=1 Tax=Meloidogyne enterolobii TaxID=390850 RepID=A0ACB0XTJ0_MELEN
MKINFRRYLLMLSIVLFVTVFYILDIFFFFIPYSSGGIKYFDNFNKTLPFVQFGRVENITFLKISLIVLMEIFATLIVFFCGFRMVRYVDLNANFDQELKRLNKLLTKVLIILVIIF